MRVPFCRVASWVASSDWESVSTRVPTAFDLGSHELLSRTGGGGADDDSADCEHISDSTDLHDDYLPS